jgi:hypothetical protein
LNFGTRDQPQLSSLPSPSNPRTQSRNFRKQPYQAQTYDQVEAQVQPQPQALAGGPRRSLSTIPPTPRGALVFATSQETQLESEFDPWKEHAQLHSPSLAIYPGFEMNSNPNYYPDPDPPPPLPPKDITLPPSRHGIQAPHNDTSKLTQVIPTISIPHRRSTHRREPALPYPPSPDPALLNPTGTNILSSGLPPASDHDTNRHSDIYEPYNDSS